MNEEEIRWDIVRNRANAHEAGVAPFVYAVVTTGVFCLPDCASRRPHRRNVRFFDSPKAAASAGFRACRRCHPAVNFSGGRGRTTTKLDRVVRVCRVIVAQGGAVPAAKLEEAAGCSSRQLGRDFAAVLGTSPRAFGQAVRAGEVRSLLRSREQVMVAVFDAGFGSVRGFYETTAPTLGMRPKQYANGGAGQVLRWTSVGSSAGLILAVAGDLGLTAVSIGTALEPMLDGVRDDLPYATYQRADRELREVADGLRALAEGRPVPADLPTDVRGTAFQSRVWSALRRIPAGQTRSYTEVAEEIGSPTAARAVAGACSSNRIALVIPCHRVVRSDGSLGGYRWGLAIKQQLLDVERRDQGR